ncbi:Holliday junction resolvase Hjc [Methanobrevibacter curvatus]|uniref:Crossover junction endodeoxyribonuclease Hjc n=1 Tax=Methanobrevibacter curvatus TaxID=49547 RepID=A0A166DH41_9EURY|nr:Holliday junction resolvase Hjc [Methanobrevibacter curvatus]KZX15596.1 archaeal holliday junction resolvase [Methanobrevibacter curvatus]
MAKKGTAEERDLVQKLWKMKFAAMRAPASGSATKHSIPDVIAGNGSIYLGIEVKTTIKDVIYVDSAQIDGLIEFCNIFGAKPYLGIKFKRTKWLFLKPENVERTKSKNYKIKKDYAIEKALELDEVLGIDKQIKF